MLENQFVGPANGGKAGSIVCLLCGAERVDLSRHLPMHKMSTARYRELFPGAPIETEAVAEQRRENGRAVGRLNRKAATVVEAGKLELGDRRAREALRAIAELLIEWCDEFDRKEGP